MSRDWELTKVIEGVSEQCAAFRLHAVEQLPFLYAVSTRVNVQTYTARSCYFECRRSAAHVLIFFF